MLKLRTQLMAPAFIQNGEGSLCPPQAHCERNNLIPKALGYVRAIYHLSRWQRDDDPHYGKNFPMQADLLFSDFDLAALDEHRDWLVGEHLDAAESHFLMSIHTWLARLGAKIILVDTACSNHKDRPSSSIFH